MAPGVRIGLRAAVCAGLLSVGCAHGGGKTDLATLASNSDQVIFEAGEKALKKRNYAAARDHFKRIIEAFAQSQYGPAARLAVGDAYFFEGGNANYILAIGAYREFLTLYPSHSKSDYAQLQVAESYFKQRNSPDRDQTHTQHALEEFQRFIDIFPDSPLVEAANARMIVCRQSLARSDFLAGYFYQRTRKAYRSAVLRYEALLKDYPDYAQMDEVLYRLGECLILVGRGAEALPHLAKLVSDYPKSEFLDDAQKLMASASSKVPPAPAPAPAPTPQASPSPPAPETRP
jgi:outer membrane protein assembly factor BamD